GAQIRRSEDRAPRERYGDALRLAGDAEADRAEVADDVDGHVRDRRLPGRIEGGVHDQLAALEGAVAGRGVGKAHDVIRLPRSARHDVQRYRRARLEVVEASAAVRLVRIEAAVALDD